MKRAQLLEVAGCGADRFETLRHRRALPFETQCEEGRQATYSPRDAFALRLFLAGTEVGLDQGAARFLANRASRMFDFEATHDQWAILLFLKPGPQEGWRAVKVARLSASPEAILKYHNEGGIHSFVAINASREWRRVQARVAA
ncbi:hypothetical protein [Tabrizicola sp. M-4]|uniref:hypothetical protein n=1 Tax=Tabrizicola sp. M-4 TaxID=3055847 RepID=UPI003DA95564